MDFWKKGAYAPYTLATATCAMPEIVEDGGNGYVVPLADMKPLADIMIELLSNPDQCARMGENGYQKYLRDYNWTRGRSQLSL